MIYKVGVLVTLDLDEIGGEEYAKGVLWHIRKAANSLAGVVHVKGSVATDLTSTIKGRK